MRSYARARPLNTTLTLCFTKIGSSVSRTRGSAALPYNASCRKAIFHGSVDDCSSCSSQRVCSGIGTWASSAKKRTPVAGLNV